MELYIHDYFMNINICLYLQLHQEFFPRRHFQFQDFPFCKTCYHLHLIYICFLYIGMLTKNAVHVLFNKISFLTETELQFPHDENIAIQMFFILYKAWRENLQIIECLLSLVYETKHSPVKITAEITI